jgi:hypothetical protein
MVHRSNYAARVPQLYESVRDLRAALDAPDILEGTRLYDTLKLYGEAFHEEELYHVADYLETRSREAHEAAVAVVREVGEAVNAVATGQREATDMEWKRRALFRTKEWIDEFLSIPPSAGVNGGKRRKTRKGKSRSRRNRYSRRR